MLNMKQLVYGFLKLKAALDSHSSSVPSLHSLPKQKALKDCGRRKTALDLDSVSKY